MMEHVRQRLSFAVRVEDAFSDEPISEVLAVTLNTGEPPVRARDGLGARHDDGTYRFTNLTPGARELSVRSPSGRGFTWDPTTALTLPLGDPRVPLRMPFFPSAAAHAPPASIALRGLIFGGAGREVRIEPVATPAPPRRTRADENGEFLFVVSGWTEIDPANARVVLRITAPVASSVEVLSGATIETFVGPTFAVPPGRETRVRFHL